MEEFTHKKGKSLLFEFIFHNTLKKVGTKTRKTRLSECKGKLSKLVAETRF
jgi:hypothetical protein